MPLFFRSFNILLYVLLWLITVVVCYKKNKRITPLVFIAFLFFIYSIVSFLLYSDFSTYLKYGDLSFFPFLYLYLMLLLSLSPLFNYHEDKVDIIINPPVNLFYAIAIFFILFSLFDIPVVIKNFTTGMTSLLTDYSSGQDMYLNTIQSADSFGSGISNIPAIYTNVFLDVSIFLLFYFLTFKKKNTLIILGLILSFIVQIMSSIAAGLRGPVINLLLTLIVATLLFKKFYTHKVYKILKCSLLTLILAISIPIALITLGRFENTSEGVNRSIISYVGQGNLNFAKYGLDDGGIRYGDRTLNLFKRPFFNNVSQNFIERRQNFPELKINDESFVTFVGDFTIDFGPILAPVIFLIFSLLVIHLTKVHHRYIYFHQLLLLFYVMCVCVQGGFSLFSYSDTGNLRIMAMIILYLYSYFTSSLSSLQHA